MRIVIMVAMEEEAIFLRPLMESSRQIKLPGVPDPVDRAHMAGAPDIDIDIVISGIGAVNASSATTAALLSGPCDAVLSCGCSGAHVVGQKMGDMVLGAQVLPLDAKVIASDGSVRYVGVRHSMTTKGTTAFEADSMLLRLAKEAAEEVRSEHAPGIRIDVGSVGSGDAWRQSHSVIHETHGATGSLCEEMEAHAVAQVAQKFKVPFLAIKDIANSELAPEDIQLEPTHHDVPEGVKVGYHAALVTAATVRRLVADSAPASNASPVASRKRPLAHDTPARVSRECKA